MAVYTRGRRRAIVALVLTSILLITLDQRGNVVIDKLRSGFAIVLQPFDAAARTVSRPVINAWHAITSYDDLIAENDRLRDELDAGRGAVIEARATLYEFRELLALAQITAASNYPTVTVGVVGAAPSNFQNTIEIDKGTNDGIRVGMPVISAAGLVGKITRAFPSSSRVLLISDPNFAVSAKLLTPVSPDGSATTTTVGSAFPDPDRTTTPSSSSVPTATSSPPTSSPRTTTAPGTSVAGSPEDPSASSVAPSTSAAATTTTIPMIVRETGLVRGQGAGEPLRFTLVGESDIEIGATVETAGGAVDPSPPGLPIGTVTGVRSQTGTREKIVEVAPAAGNLSTVNFLSVILYLPNTGG